ncbi:MAG: 30S ribosome-binding factor RbfA [Pseudomonadota bacterium]
MARNAHTGASGPSQRQLRVGELIRRALSDVLARGELFDPALERTSVTVGEVRTTPDLRTATVYVLPLGGSGAEDVIDALNNNRTELRRQVNRAVALKFSPQLKFVVDTSFDQMDATRRLLSDPDVMRDLAPGDKGNGAP